MTNLKKSSLFGLIPPHIINLLDRSVAEAAGVELAVNGNLPDPPRTAGRTEGRHPWDDNYPYAPRNYAYRELTPVEIEAMRVSAPIAYGMAMKKAPIHAVIRDVKSWTVECSSKRGRALVQAILRRILPKYMGDILECLEYGHSVFEIVAHLGPAGQLGLLGDGLGADRQVAAVKKLNACYPGSVDLRYDDQGRLDGFTQYTKGGRVDVPLDRTLLFTNPRRYRRKEGESYLRASFSSWYWYEIVWKAFVQFLIRTGKPVVICRYPESYVVKDRDGNETEARVAAMQLAMSAQTSNAIALPSTVDDDTQEPLWKLEYMKEDQQGDQFIRALETLEKQITRGLVMADTMMASGEIGKGAPETQRTITNVHTQAILDNIVSHINEYLIPRIMRWNFGPAAPAAAMTTVVIDREGLDRYFQILQMGINSKGEILDLIDWRAMMENVAPLLTEQQVQQLKKATEVQEKRGPQVEKTKRDTSVEE